MAEQVKPLDLALRASELAARHAPDWHTWYSAARRLARLALIHKARAEVAEGRAREADAACGASDRIMLQGRRELAEARRDLERLTYERDRARELLAQARAVCERRTAERDEARRQRDEARTQRDEAMNLAACDEARRTFDHTLPLGSLARSRGGQGRDA